MTVTVTRTEITINILAGNFLPSDPQSCEGLNLRQSVLSYCAEMDAMLPEYEINWNIDWNSEGCGSHDQFENDEQRNDFEHADQRVMQAQSFWVYE